jgi:hypothetical protein
MIGPLAPPCLTPRHPQWLRFSAQPPSLLATRSRETLKAHVARMVNSQPSVTPLAGDPARGAAPEGSATAARRSNKKARTKGHPGPNMPPAATVALAEWYAFTKSFCAENTIPVDTKAPCVYQHCTRDDSGASCALGGNCRYWHSRPPASQAGRAQSLYDVVLADMKSRHSDELPFAR